MNKILIILIAVLLSSCMTSSNKSNYEESTGYSLAKTAFTIGVGSLAGIHPGAMAASMHNNNEKKRNAELRRTQQKSYYSSDSNNKTMGVVVLDHYTCKSYDHIVIETNNGFTTAQVYIGYANTFEGDIVYGDLHSYGMEDIFDFDNSEVGRIYIDDYWVGKNTATDWCYNK